MTWSKLSDDFFRHPKILAVGKDARDLFIAALCHCNEHLTDGFVDARFLRHLGAAADVDDPKALAALLTTVLVAGKDCLWHEAPGGYLVHDFLEYNLSREQHTKNAEEARRRKEEFAARQKAIAEGRDPDAAVALLRQARTGAQPPTGTGDTPATPAKKPRHKVEQRSEHKAEQRSEHKAEQRSEHKAEQRSEHKAEQRSEHKAEQRSEHPLPESRIPSPGIRNPEPNQPPNPPGGTGLSPPDTAEADLDAGCLVVLDEMMRFAPSREEAVAVLTRRRCAGLNGEPLDCEPLRWEVAALEWRIENRRPGQDEIALPWNYLLDCLAREPPLPLPAPVKARRDAEKAQRDAARQHAERQAEADEMRRRAEAAAVQVEAERQGRDAEKTHREACDAAWMRIEGDERAEIQAEVEGAMCRENVVWRHRRDKYGAGWAYRPDALPEFRSRRDALLMAWGRVGRLPLYSSGGPLRMVSVGAPDDGPADARLEVA